VRLGDLFKGIVLVYDRFYFPCLNQIFEEY
jgi:hypothetical protein